MNPDCPVYINKTYTGWHLIRYMQILEKIY